MPPLLVAGHPRQLPHTPAPTAEVIDMDAEKKAVPVVLPAPVYNSLAGDVIELPAEKIKAVDGFPVSAGFRREGAREASFMCSIGVYIETIDEKTAPADNPKGTLHFERHIKTNIKYEKMMKI